MTLNMQEIYTQSSDLLKRFDLHPLFDASWAKCIEEFSELAEAIYELEERPKHEKLREDAAEEWADVAVTLFNAMYTNLFAQEDFDALKTLEGVWDVARGASDRRSASIAFMRSTYALYKDLTDNSGGLPDDLQDEYTVISLYECLSALCSVGKQSGLTYAEIEVAMLAVFQKNRDKTPEKYVIHNGQITKREKVAS